MSGVSASAVADSNAMRRACGVNSVHRPWAFVWDRREGATATISLVNGCRGAGVQKMHWSHDVLSQPIVWSHTGFVVCPCLQGPLASCITHTNLNSAHLDTDRPSAVAVLIVARIALALVNVKSFAPTLVGSRILHRAYSRKRPSSLTGLPRS